MIGPDRADHKSGMCKEEHNVDIGKSEETEKRCGPGPNLGMDHTKQTGIWV